MKATKKIVGAACALVAAVALAAGSTFAWFSSNGEVNATGLEIDVSTSNAYLIIGKSAAELKDNKKDISLALAEGETATKLLPAAYEDDATLTPGGEKYICTEGTWYTAEGVAAADGTLKDGTKVNLTTQTFSSYVVTADMYVSVSEGSPAVSSVVMEMAATPDWSESNTEATNNSVISVVILYQTMENNDTATEGAWTKVEANQANSHVIGDSGKLDLGAVEYGKYIKIRVMVYMDGNNVNVKTTNSLNLTGVTLDFKFTDNTPAPSGD